MRAIWKGSINFGLVYIPVSVYPATKEEKISFRQLRASDFVEQAQINPKFFYKPYFLEPQKGGEKAYALLHKALTSSNKLGVAKVAIQEREYLAAVKPDGL